MEILEKLLPFVGEHLPTIVATIFGLIGSLVYKGNADKEDAVASLKTGVLDFFQANPAVKATLADGKLDKEEWKMIFKAVGPAATTVATKGGAKVLKRWTGPVANKYIEAVARELANEFKDAPAETTE